MHQRVFASGRHRDAKHNIFGFPRPSRRAFNFFCVGTAVRGGDDPLFTVALLSPLRRVSHEIRAVGSGILAKVKTIKKRA